MQNFPHHYQVTATCGVEDNIAVTSADLPSLQTNSPPEFDGPPGLWSPETLLTAAVANCFILTFRAVARALLGKGGTWTAPSSPSRTRAPPTGPR